MTEFAIGNLVRVGRTVIAAPSTVLLVSSVAGRAAGRVVLASRRCVLGSGRERVQEALRHAMAAVLHRRRSLEARLEIGVGVVPNVLRVMVPGLSLRPLVANAVRHGVESQSGWREVVVVGTDVGLEVEVLPGFVGGVCAG